MNSNPFNWSILICLAVVWGSSFILMKRGLEAFSPEQVAAYRIFIAFVFMLPFTFFHLRKDLHRHWKGLLGIGLFGNFIPAFLFTKAETGISSALTGMLNSLTPLFTLLLGVLFFGNKAKAVHVIGIGLGLAGAVALLYLGQESDFANNLSFGIYVVIATLCYGLSVNIIRKTMTDVTPVTAAVWSMCMIGPLAGAYLFSTDFIHILYSHPKGWSSLLYTSILGIFGTALSVMIFNILVRNTTTLFASSVTYLIPIVAMLWGIADGEEVLWLHFACIALILTGIYLVTRK
ncbi:MAG: EamA family transporter [Bacteroidota bacterium]